MVFYRKYRPQRVSDLDLDDVREKLTAVLKADSFPHAYLFTGPKGLGKTSAARIVAKAINCEHKLTTNKPQLTSNKKKSEVKSEKLVVSSEKLDVESIEPCNKCSACISITNGSNIDVLEIDAASNRGVDEIRDLREKVKFTPAALSKKVYIIDEVHMLTPEAFNALLKTLEEPPEHAIFILCTTESWKLPTTITSRTFIVQFEKPTIEELNRSLRRIIDGEKLKIDDKTLDRVYQLAEGSFRDGSKILEELSVISEGKQITDELFEKVFKTQSVDQNVAGLVACLATKNVTGALQIISKLTSLGVDMRLVTQAIVEALRKLLLLKSGIKQDIEDITSFDKKDIQLLIEGFQKAYQQLKYTPIPSLPLELAIVEWCIKEEVRIMNYEVRNIEKNTDVKVPSLEKSQIEKELPKKGIQNSPASPSEAGRAELRIQSLNNDEKESLEKKIQIKPQSLPANNHSDVLYKLIDEIKKENQTIAGVLRSCKILEISDKEIIIQTPYPFHREKLNMSVNLTILNKKLADLFGKELTLIIN